MTKEITIPSDLPDVDRLSLDQVYKILPYIDDLTDWLKSIKAFATEQGLQGKEIPGHKLVAGRMSRKWNIPTEEVLKLCADLGIDPFQAKLKTPPQVEKASGKQIYQDSIEEFVDKVPGKLALKPNSAKGKAVDMGKRNNSELDSAITKLNN